MEIRTVSRYTNGGLEIMLNTQPRQKLKDYRPKTEVEVAGVRVNALWDTGSIITIISQAVFSRLQYHPVALPIPPFVKIRAANGGQLDIVYYCYVTFQCLGRTMTRPTYVISNLSTGCILGADTMREERIMVDMELSEVYFKPGVPARQLYLRTTKSVQVAELSDLLIPCQVVSTGESNDMILETKVRGLGLIDDMTLPSLARAPAATVTVRAGRANVVLSNSLGAPALVPRGTLFAVSMLSQNDIITETEAIDITEDMDIVTVNAVSGTRAIRRADSILSKVDLTNIPGPFQAQFRKLLSDYAGMINDESADVGKCNLLPQKINLIDKNKIAATPPYRVPPALQPVVDTFVDKLLQAGIIRPSTSPFSSPLMLVKKPHASQSHHLGFSCVQDEIVRPRVALQPCSH